MLALAGAVFLVSSTLLVRQDVVTDPKSASSWMVRIFSPATPGGAASRPVLRCSLNCVDALDPGDVWVVGNRRLVLHSADVGATWTQVVLPAAVPSPPEAAPAPSARPRAKAALETSFLPVVQAAILPPRRIQRVHEDVPVRRGGPAKTSDPACSDEKADDPAATCAYVEVRIPPGAQVRHVRALAAEAGGEFVPCAPVCALERARFVGEPIVKGDLVTWRFKNASPERDRVARVEVEYEPADATAATTPTPPPYAQNTYAAASPSAVPAAASPSAPPAEGTPSLPPPESPPAAAPSAAPSSPPAGDAEDLVGVWFERTTPAGRGWILSRTGMLYATADAGATWQPRGSVGTFATPSAAASARARIASWTGASGYALLRSAYGAHVRGDAIWSAGLDGRVTRAPVAQPAQRVLVALDSQPLYGVFFKDDRLGWAVGAKGRIVALDARAQTARPVEGRTRSDLYSVAFLPDGIRGWAAGAGGTLLATTNGGGSWMPASVAVGDRPWPWMPRVPYWYLGTSLLAFGLLLRAARIPDPEVPDESIADTPNSDRPVESPREDLLDFESVARGLSRFLRNEKTTPPLTVAIVGEWGTGKSSLMNLLRADLQQFGFRSVWFNAWHHQKEEHLLAALLQTIRLQAIPSIWTPSGWEFRWRLARIRGFRHWIRIGLVMGLFALVAGYASTHRSGLDHAVQDLQTLLGGSWPADIFGPGAPHGAIVLFLGSAVSVVVTVVKLLKPFGVNPASLLATVAGSGNLSALEAQTSFRHQFAAEFRDVSRALGPRTMPIFIDDLDRCRPQQVADLLEAVSFLITSGDCFVVMGMARDRVERCVGLSFKELADEMEGPTKSAEVAWERRAEFARQYLDKLVNIEVPIQPPTDNQTMNLLVKNEAAGPSETMEALRAVLGLWPLALLGVFLAVLFWAGWMAPSLAPVVEESPAPIATKAPSGGPVSTPAAVPPPSPAPVAEPVETALSPSDPSAFPPGATADEKGELGLLPRLPWFLSYAIVWPVGLAVAVLSASVLSRRRDLVVKDSAEFRRALQMWHAVVVADHPPPRSLKRFVNRLRYLAMRQRPYPPAPPLWRALLEKVLPGAPAATAPLPTGDRIPESALVALAALEEVAPQAVAGPVDASRLPRAAAEALAAHEQAFGSPIQERFRAAYARMTARVVAH